MLTEQPDTKPNRASLAQHVVPRDLDTPRVGPQQGGQNTDQSGLARAVGPEHPVHGAARDPQIEPVQRLLDPLGAVAP